LTWFDVAVGRRLAGIGSRYAFGNGLTVEARWSVSAAGMDVRFAMERTGAAKSGSCDRELRGIEDHIDRLNSRASARGPMIG